MYWWEFLLFGGFGAALVEGLDLAAEIRARGDWPWESMGIRATPYLLASFARVSIGGVLAVGLGLSGQLATSGSAVITGVAAPLIVTRLGRSAVSGTEEYDRPQRRASVALTERVLADLPRQVAERVLDSLREDENPSRSDALSQVDVREIAHSLGTPLSMIETSALTLGRESRSISNNIVDAVRTCNAFLIGYREVALRGVSAGRRDRHLESSVEAAARVYSNNVHYRGRVEIDFPLDFQGYSNTFILILILPLLENAIEHSPTAAPILVRGLFVDEFIQLSVRSRSASSELDERIYEEEFSTKDGHQGLGLSTVRRLLAAQRGADLRHTVDGENVTFVVSLPGRES